MKNTLFSFVLLLIAAAAFSQSSKMVQWNYSVKKITDKSYEVHITATITGDFHLYAQDAGGEGPIPTAFTFVKSPLIQLEGKVKEHGVPVKKFETAWGHDVRYYEKTVDFVQVVNLRSKAKSDLIGKVEFMVCNDKQCLPPATVDIKVSVGG